MSMSIIFTNSGSRGRRLAAVAGMVLAGGVGWALAQEPARPAGKDVFRHDTFGNETFWTDTLRMHEVISSSVDPTTALAVGLKVDADALPPGILKTVDLKSPATTVALLKMNAVVGLKGTVESRDGKDVLTRVGVTCALCHSTVDDSVMPGIGKRLDGWPNTSLNPGAIIALSPALDAAKKAVYSSWGPGKYDPRFNQDGKNGPVVIPPAFGLAGVKQATFTGDGDITYWNRYVAVTQMGGHGAFSEPRLGISVLGKGADLVAPKLPALKAYQHGLAKPAPRAGSFDAAAAGRGRQVFAGAGQCARCHSGASFTDGKLHAAAETGMDAAYAARSATKKYRATPLRALWQHPPYFHDGRAASLGAVVDHYETALKLKLSAEQKKDLVEYLKSI
jgi:cytochrome c553